MLILSHNAIGGFLMHCGWNSTFEALCAGVPMITWPIFSEQFLNEKVIVDLLKVGYRVGVDVYVEWGQEESIGVVLKREEIERGVRKLMDKSSEEYEEMKRKVVEIGEMGRRAMESGGSSHLNLSLFIQDIANQVREKTALIQSVESGVSDDAVVRFGDVAVAGGPYVSPISLLGMMEASTARFEFEMMFLGVDKICNFLGFGPSHSFSKISIIALDLLVNFYAFSTMLEKDDALGVLVVCQLYSRWSRSLTSVCCLLSLLILASTGD
ncbi:hypothetical protein Syun_000683 [Stephania yunnanensis]|uniref:Uncharacterized protein n=1 Tax=Stephania yunnanensis TaxID=152371 RepID=A0AAP0LDK4_9MAGN